MRHITVCILLIFGVLTSFAQASGDTELTGSQKTEVQKRIEQAHQSLTTLSAQFTQEKSSALFAEKTVQKGKMSYKSPKKLRWEYTTPKAMSLIINDNKVMLKNDKGTIPSPNKMLNEMGSLIINTVNGSLLQDNTMFSTRYYKNTKSGAITIALTPTAKKIKGVYAKISIVLDGKSHLANKVILEEVSGDITTITFTDKESNITLPPKTFE